MILKLTIMVFATQLVFIGARTWNVRAVSKGDLMQTLLSGAVVNTSWLISIAIGATSMNQIITDFEWKYMPVVVASVAGGLVGAWLGMKDLKRKKQ